MSGFFRRFKPANQEKTSRDGGNENKVKNSVALSSAMGSLENQESQSLSLFSGMTFSSDSISSHTEEQTSSKLSKSASTELAEAGLEFHDEEISLQNKETVLPAFIPVTQDADEAESCKEPKLQCPEHPENIPVKVEQQTRKKKKIQAKRPGYARDSKQSTSPEKKGLLTISSNQEESQAKNYDSGRLDSTEEPSLHELAHQMPGIETSNVSITGLAVKDDKSLDQKDCIIPSTEDCELNKDDGNEKDLGDTEDAAKREKRNDVYQSHQLYSITTPTSSEENLSHLTAVDEDKPDLEDNNLRCSVNPNNSFETMQEKLDGNDGNDSNKSVEHEDIAVEYIKTTERSDCEQQTSKETELEKQHEDTNKDKEESDNKMDELPAKPYEFSIGAEDKFTMMMQDLQFQISSLNEDEDSLALLMAFVMENYSDIGSSCLEKQTLLMNLTEQESNALADDNYDLAEELAAEIEQVKHDLEKSKFRVPVSDVKVQEALTLLSEISTRSLSIHREAQIGLEELRDQEVDVLDKMNEENTSKNSKEKQSLNLEKQRIERTRAHLLIDNEHLEKEENILNEEIDERTKEFMDYKRELMDVKQSIQKEICDLEEKLRKLKLKESQCKIDIDEQDRKIAEILEEFSPQRNALELQKQDLKNQQTVLDGQQEALVSSQKTYDNLNEEWNKKRNRQAVFLESVQLAIDNNTSIIDSLERKRAELEDFQLLKHYVELNNDPYLNELKSSAIKSQQQIKTLHTKVQLSKRLVSSLRKNVSEIEAQISAINDAKDVAKKERNFKEAKKLKEESESLNTEGIEKQNKLETISHDLERDEELLKNEEKEFEKISEILKEEEFKSAIQLVKNAAKVAQELDDNLMRYKSNDFLHTLVTAEISVCQNIIKDLCSKHDIATPDNNFNEEKTQRITSLEESLLVVDKTKIQDLLEELETKLEVVVELEDFDEAELIQGEIDGLKTRLM